MYGLVKLEVLLVSVDYLIGTQHTDKAVVKLMIEVGRVTELVPYICV